MCAGARVQAAGQAGSGWGSGGSTEHALPVRGGLHIRALGRPADSAQQKQADGPHTCALSTPEMIGQIGVWKPSNDPGLCSLAEVGD